ncbi:MAG: UvrD-helicase domain-containing protein [bacterium]
MLTVYKSSAGSVKTYTLVKEYLRICLSRPSKFSKILAITFTNKASAEMKERIITCIHQFINEGTNELINELIEEHNLNKEKIRKNCEILGDFILHSYSHFSVMTIDSFISRVVKTFAYDLDMPLTYEVELDTDYMFNQIIENLLVTAEEDNFVGTVLTQFALSKIYSSGSWHLDNELKKIGKVTFNEKYIDPVLEIAHAQYDDTFWIELILELEKEVSIFRKKINSMAAKAVEIIDENGLTVDDFFQKSKGPAGALVKYKVASRPKEFKINSWLEKNKWVTKKCEQKNPEKFKKIQNALEQGVLSYAHEIMNYIQDNKIIFNTHYLILKNIYSEALIKKFLDFKTEFKQEKNKIPLLDFGLKVAEVIKRESVPFLYWRMGDTYNNIMIDEFQDTSFLQWTNLLPLLEESLSTGNSNMVVGDGKQAIYRWRAGDVRIMEQEIEENFNQHIKTKVLENNYRSTSEIVDFNNKFFSQVKKHLNIDDELFDKIYSEDLVLQNPVKPGTGFIKIAEPSFNDNNNKEEKDACKLQNLSEEIQKICQENNGYNFGDIAVLVRKNKECDAVAQYLSEHGIPVMSPDSLILKNSSAVRFVISVLEYIARDDLIALYNMWLNCGNPAAEFRNMQSSDIDIPFIEHNISPEFTEKKLILYHLPVYEAVEEIIRIFQLNTENPGYVQGFLEVVFDYSEKFKSDIHGFLDWWDEYSDSDKTTLPAAEYKNAVRVSTIHKAKGLEFPIVFVPFSWNLFDSSSGLKQHIIWVWSDKLAGKRKNFPFMVDVQKDMEESYFKQDYEKERKLSILDNINLLYVAFTRPKDRLYIYYEPGKNSAVKTTSDLIEKNIQQMSLTKVSNFWTKGEKAKKERPEVQFLPHILEGFNTQSWRHKITIRKRSHDLWKLEDEERTRKVDWGILVHSILSEIRIFEDIDKAIENKYREGHLSSKEKFMIREDIHRIMKLEYTGGKVEDWFRSGLQIMNEKTIVTSEKEYRPDKVIKDNNRIILIDYKTGIQNRDHVLQLEKYGVLLKKMGYNNIKKYILYLNTGVIKEV